MLILFDNGTPAPLRQALAGHVVVEAIERGWERLANGELIAAAEAGGFEPLLTTDKNMRYQQDLTGSKLAFVVLGNQQWPTLRRYVDRVAAAVNAAKPDSYTEVELPFAMKHHGGHAPPPIKYV
jgi:hypothetical protein